MVALLSRGKCYPSIQNSVCRCDVIFYKETSLHKHLQEPYELTPLVVPWPPPCMKWCGVCLEGCRWGPIPAPRADGWCPCFCFDYYINSALWLGLANIITDRSVPHTSLLCTGHFNTLTYTCYAQSIRFLTVDKKIANGIIFTFNSDHIITEVYFL